MKVLSTLLSTTANTITLSNSNGDIKLFSRDFASIGFNSGVNTITVQSDGKWLIGGNFFSTYNNISANNIVRLNTDSTIDPTFNYGSGFNSNVNAFAIQHDNKILVGGGFNSYQGIFIRGFARLNTNGSLDTTLFSSSGFIGGSVKTIGLQTDGNIIVGGQFILYNGVSASKIVRINITGGTDSTFNYGTGFNNDVNSIAIQTDGKILVGGAFTTYKGSTANQIIRLNTTGGTDSSFVVGTGFNGTVQTIKLQSDGKIIVAGNFTTYSGATVNRIVRLNTNGSIDSTFTTGTAFNNTVFGMFIQTDGKIVLGGDFTTYNGTGFNRIVRLNTTGGTDSTFVIGTGFNSTVNAINVLSSGTVLVGGSFSSYNGHNANSFAKLTSTGTYSTAFDYHIDVENTPLQYSSDLSSKFNTRSIIDIGYFNNNTKFGNGLSKSVTNLTTLGGLITGNTTLSGFTKMIVGGNSLTLSSIQTNIKLNSSLIFGAGFDGTIFGLARQSNGKYVAGGFYSFYNAVSANKIITLNPDGSIDPVFAYGSGFNGIVRSVAVQSDGKIVASGDFSSYNGKSANHIVRLNPNGTIDSTFNYGTGLNSNASQGSLIIQPDGKIIVGGQFTSYNGTSINRIVRINTDGTIDSTFNVGTGFNNIVFSLALQADGKIIAGGSFSSFNGVGATRVVRLNSTGGTDTSFTTGSGFNNSVLGLAVQSDGKILATGSFSSYNGTGANQIIRLNTTGGTDSSFVYGTGFNAQGHYVSYDATNNKIYVGGNFTTYNGTTTGGLVRINPSNGSLDSTFMTNIGTGFNNSVETAVFNPDGTIVFGGTFSAFNGFNLALPSPFFGGCILKLNQDGTFPSSITVDTPFTYTANFANKFTARSVVDYGTVTGLTSGISGVKNQLSGLTITTTYSATTASNFIGVSASTSFNVYLPVAPKAYQNIIVSDMLGNAAVNNITINGNGKLIAGNSTAIIDTNYGTINLVYNTIGWSLISVA